MAKRTLTFFQEVKKLLFQKRNKKYSSNYYRSIDLKLFIHLIKNYLILRFMKKPWANLLSHFH